MQDKAAQHNVIGTLPSNGYTVFPGVDMPGHYELIPVDLSAPVGRNANLACSNNHTAPNITQVNACASSRGVCCIDTGPYQVSATCPL